MKDRREFITGGISLSCIDNRFFATDANGNTKGYLSLDSLIDQRKTFIPLTAHEKESRPTMGEWGRGCLCRSDRGWRRLLLQS